jgi:hypothetical protein
LPKSHESTEGEQLWANEIENNRRDVQELVIKVLNYLATRTNPNADTFVLPISGVITSRETEYRGTSYGAENPRANYASGKLVCENDFPVLTSAFSIL